MEHAFTIAALWMGLALISIFLSSFLRVSNALMEIIVGIAAAGLLVYLLGQNAMGSNESWLTFLASTGAILLTFLAGTELEPSVIKTKLKEVLIVGAMGFFAPFLGCTLIAKFVLQWSNQSSLLGGIALSTTSMAVVYAVMLEKGFNRNEYGKGILGACFVNDLGTVIALSFIFAPFTWKTLVFVAVSVLALFALPFLTPRLVNHYAFKTVAFRTKWVLFILFGLGALAIWSGSEAVLPAYLAGMVLSKALGRDNAFIRRIRTLTIGFASPFYFIRAGSLVSLPSLLTAPLFLIILFLGKVMTKIIGLYPIIAKFRKDRNERYYYTLMMSTGLTFGTISSLYGFSHGIINQTQYSILVTVVIASAVIPTMIANFFFLPKHLLGEAESQTVQGKKIDENETKGLKEELI